MVEFLNMILQALLSLVLGIFGFSWDAPKDAITEDTVKETVVRLLTVEPDTGFNPQVRFTNYEMPTHSTNSSDCSSAKANALVIDLQARPITISAAISS